MDDMDFAENLMKKRSCKPRHIIILFHDVLEFLMYEALQVNDIDIYNNGQNTVGFDKALSLLIKLNYKPSYMATIREIQKLRGDAKHHAQDVDWSKLEELEKRWQIICVCITWDLVSPAAKDVDLVWAAERYSNSQYSLYRKSRNNNWELACHHLLAAIVHKKCDIDNYLERPVGQLDNNLNVSIKTAGEMFKRDAGKAEWAASEPKIIKAIGTSDWVRVSDELAKIYSLLESSNPTIFDSESATFLTRRLALANGSRFKGGTAWTEKAGRDTVGYVSASESIAATLHSAPELIKKFGAPFYEEEDDNYWKWWDFVVFDGEEWHSFQLHDNFAISPELFHPSGNDYEIREKVAKVILNEFKLALVDNTDDNQT